MQFLLLEINKVFLCLMSYILCLSVQCAWRAIIGRESCAERIHVFTLPRQGVYCIGHNMYFVDTLCTHKMLIKCRRATAVLNWHWRSAAKNFNTNFKTKLGLATDLMHPLTHKSSHSTHAQWGYGTSYQLPPISSATSVVAFQKVALLPAFGVLTLGAGSRLL